MNVATVALTPCTLIINCREKFTEEMKKYCGKTIKINENMERSFNKYGIFIYKGRAISTDMLEPYVISKEEKEDLFMKIQEVSLYLIQEMQITMLQIIRKMGKIDLQEE